MRIGTVGILSVVCVVFAAHIDAAEVRLRSSAVCAGSVVRLADVAEVHASEPELAAALSDVPLCAAPARGAERQFTQHDVRQLLVLSGLAAAAVQVTGSETVTLLTESSGVAANKRQRSAFATHRQAAFEVEIPGGRESSVRQAAARPVQPSGAMAEESRPPRLVERGALCTVHARTAGIRVTTQGKALQAGALGDTISIEMAETKERVLGRIAGSQIVEVGVGSTSVEQRPEPVASLLPVPVASK
jgi:flagella basal body P-ring formation protein FlgA